MLQAYTANFEKIRYAIYSDEFVVDHSILMTDENHWKFVKDKLDRRNERRARCVIGNITMREV